MRLRESEDALEKLNIELKEEKGIRTRVAKENADNKRRAAEIEDDFEKLQQQCKSDYQEADKQISR